MKFSKKVKKCGLSPMRKFHPYAVEAEKAGKKIYHLNIGQPDIETPPQYFEAVRNFHQPVLEYAPSPGLPVLIEAIQKYYDALGMHFEQSEILITTGGSEALQIVFNCILDDGDEILIPEPFYPNYNTMVNTCGAVIHPIHTKPEEGYHYADRAKVEAEITPRTRAIVCTNPGNPTGSVLTPEEMRMMVDIAKEHDLFIIGDEAYREFVYAGEPLQSLGEFADAADKLHHQPQQGADGRSHQILPGPPVGSDLGPDRVRGAVRCGAGVFRRRAGGIQAAPRHGGGEAERDSRRDLRVSAGSVLPYGSAAGRRRGRVPEVASNGL